ncbi:MAG TPA: hypothetical protein VGQ17_11350, partial [Gemmatimonadales bacterium]|nr:hypothetical protein [Gemmatimonadales bacterium]
MKKPITEQHASGLVSFLVPVVAVVTACTAPIEPMAPAAPSVRIASAAPGRIAATFSRSITIDFTLVPNTDQENFPVLISGTYDGTGGTPDLRTTGNGGKVQSASGYDVGFYTNSSCSKGKMRWETEKYTAQTGEVVYWVRVPT